MPSWNIHTAHVERLLAEYDQEELGIHDVNCFLFGNLVPDIYVGYMVAHTTRTIPYGATHLTDPTFMPCPMQIFFGIHMLCPAQVYKKRPFLHLERGHILWQIGVTTARCVA